MALAAGTRLGPYEILEPLGAGGMGEVYRARDTRLKREVALKVLPTEHASDPARLRRFETEARAVAALNHPHILSIFDLGSDDGTTYIVFELLEGRSLRSVLEDGPLPTRKVVDYAQQICRGLDTAHARGILHRDLKPDNLFLSAEGQIKILDFGLAKLRPSAEDSDASGETRPTETRPDAVLGTVGYMSPEQVRGKAADARTDLFSLGTVLYEMLAGHQPFRRETAADTLSAILHHEPREIIAAEGPMPAGLERVVRRCLEKDPQERFRSALDVAFALDALSSSSGAAIGPASETGERRFGVRLGATGLAALVVIGLVLIATGPAAWFLGQRSALSRLPEITQITFRRGLASPARFAPDGRTVVFSALWDNRPSEIFRMRLEDLEPEPLGLVNARLLAVSPQTELAVLLGPPGQAGVVRVGTLARLPLSGGPPREVLRDVIAADWSPDGREMAVLCKAAPTSYSTVRLEYPIGTVLAGEIPWASEVRVHPTGERVAVLTAEAALIIDRSGAQQRVALPPEPSGGLAWDPGGEALWISARRPGQEEEAAGSGLGPSRGLWRVTPDGRAQEVYRSGGDLGFNDISREGRILAHLGTIQSGVRVNPPGKPSERELPTNGKARLVEHSGDGTQILTEEELPRSVQAYLRPAAGGPGVRVAVEPLSTVILTMTRDSQWVLVARRSESARVSETAGPLGDLVLIPTGPGQERVIPSQRFERIMHIQRTDRDGDDRNVLLAWAAEHGRAIRGWMRRLPEGEWVPLTPEGVVYCWLRWPQGEVIGLPESDIGKHGVVTFTRYPLDGGPSQPFDVLVPPGWAFLITWAADGRFGGLSNLPGQWGQIPTVLRRVDLSTGDVTPWFSVQPQDLTGLLNFHPVIGIVDPEAPADFHVYSYRRALQDLYLFEGLR